MRHQYTNNRGIALAILVTLILLMAVIVVSVGLLSVQTLGDVARQTYETQAYYVAEAGITEAVDKLKQNNAYAGAFTNTLPVPTPLPAKYTPHLPWSYSVVVTNGTGTAPDGTTVPTGFAYVSSTGSIPLRTGLVTQTVDKKVTVFLTQFQWNQYAMFIDKGVVIQGSAKPYKVFSSPLNPPLGRIATNALTINFNGGPVVDGDITLGSGADVTAFAQQNSGNYTGAVTTSPPVALPPVPMPSSLPPPPLHNGDPGTYLTTFSPSGNVQLTAGTYYFLGGVWLSGQADITLDSTVSPSNPAIIYYQGSWDSAGSWKGGVNSGGLAGALQIYGISAGTSTPATVFNLSGTKDSAFTLYAPLATVSILGNYKFVGSIVANYLTLGGNATVVYDSTLGNQPFLYKLWIQRGYRRW